MAQGWDELLFAHWPLPFEALRPLIPPDLTVETFGGAAWLGVVPFTMRRVRLRLRPLPALPGLSAFPELNVRTYVTYGGRPGVYFFSLDAANRTAVAAARRWYHLPYYRARMSARRVGDAVAYASLRTHRGAPPAAFRARYRPDGAMFMPPPGTLERWLVERYCLYASDGRGRLQRGEVRHGPWRLQPAAADVRVNSMARAAGIALPATAPLLHYSARQDVVVWPIRPV